MFAKYLNKAFEKCQKHLDSFINFVVKSKSSKDNEALTYSKSPIIFGLYVVFVFVVLGGGWAAFAPLASAAHASGIVISEINKQNVQTSHNGRVKKFFVKQGDLVNTNQILLELEDSEYKAKYINAVERYLEALAHKNCLISQRDKASQIQFDPMLLNRSMVPKIATMLDIQKHLFKEEKETYNANNNKYKKKIDQLIEKELSCTDKIKSAKESLNYVTQELAINEKLEKEGFASKSKSAELYANKLKCQSKLSEVKSEKMTYGSEIQSTYLEMSAYNHDYLTKILNNLEQQNSKFWQAYDMLVAAEESFKNTCIRSPIDGVVNNISKNSHIMLSNASMNVAEITPRDKDLVLEAKIGNDYIDTVQVGQITKIKFLAFKSRTSPIFSGVLVSLSPNIQTSQQHPQQKPYYTGIIHLDQEELNKFLKARKLKIVSGMNADIQIITGQRTLLRYMLDPILAKAFKAFKEK